MIVGSLMKYSCNILKDIIHFCARSHTVVTTSKSEGQDLAMKKEVIWKKMLFLNH